MTQKQFLKALRIAFFRYYFIRKDSCVASLHEIVELIEEYTNAIKNKQHD